MKRKKIKLSKQLQKVFGEYQAEQINLNSSFQVYHIQYDTGGINIKFHTAKELILNLYKILKTSRKIKRRWKK